MGMILSNIVWVFYWEGSAPLLNTTRPDSDRISQIAKPIVMAGLDPATH
jgi:hypothetical protein